MFRSTPDKMFRKIRELRRVAEEKGSYQDKKIVLVLEETYQNAIQTNDYTQVMERWVNECNRRALNSPVIKLLIFSEDLDRLKPKSKGIQFFQKEDNARALLNQLFGKEMVIQELIREDKQIESDKVMSHSELLKRMQAAGMKVGEGTCYGLTGVAINRFVTEGEGYLELQEFLKEVFKVSVSEFEKLKMVIEGARSTNDPELFKITVENLLTQFIQEIAIAQGVYRKDFLLLDRDQDFQRDLNLIGDFHAKKLNSFLGHYTHESLVDLFKRVQETVKEASAVLLDEKSDNPIIPAVGIHFMGSGHSIFIGYNSSKNIFDFLDSNHLPGKSFNTDQLDELAYAVENSQYLDASNKKGDFFSNVIFYTASSQNEMFIKKFQEKFDAERRNFLSWPIQADFVIDYNDCNNNDLFSMVIKANDFDLAEDILEQIKKYSKEEQASYFFSNPNYLGFCIHVYLESGKKEIFNLIANHINQEKLVANAKMGQSNIIELINGNDLTCVYEVLDLYQQNFTLYLESYMRLLAHASTSGKEELRDNMLATEKMLIRKDEDISFLFDYVENAIKENNINTIKSLLSVKFIEYSMKPEEWAEMVILAFKNNATIETMDFFIDKAKKHGCQLSSPVILKEVALRSAEPNLAIKEVLELEEKYEFQRSPVEDKGAILHELVGSRQFISLYQTGTFNQLYEAGYIFRDMDACKFLDKIISKYSDGHSEKQLGLLKNVLKRHPTIKDNTDDQYHLLHTLCSALGNKNCDRSTFLQLIQDMVTEKNITARPSFDKNYLPYEILIRNKDTEALTILLRSYLSLEQAEPQFLKKEVCNSIHRLLKKDPITRSEMLQVVEKSLSENSKLDEVANDVAPKKWTFN